MMDNLGEAFHLVHIDDRHSATQLRLPCMPFNEILNWIYFNNNIQFISTK